ncbi:MAG: hypothetical protein ACRDOH_00855 [Streptosporangiaceae bacterium]
MLPVSWDTVRLFLHLLAATIWVGGRPAHTVPHGPWPRRHGRAHRDQRAGRAFPRRAAGRLKDEATLPVEISRD